MSQKEYPLVRMSRVANGWQVSTADANGAFSGLMFPFGVRLQKELAVPVGLIVVARNGASASHYITGQMLKDDAALYEKYVKSYRYEGHMSNWQSDMKIYEAEVKKAAAEGKPVARKPPPPEVAGRVSGRSWKRVYDGPLLSG
jgi:sialate O-acetylesterase